MTPIRFVDFRAQRERLGHSLDNAIEQVLDHGQFILGPEVQEFEQALAYFEGVEHAITCGNGTDALVLVLMALGIGPGDAVLVPDFTFVATAEAVVLVGATPIFVDVDFGTGLFDSSGIPLGLEAAKKANVKPRALIAVDLYGHPADYPAIRQSASEAGLTIISDCAQAFGARLNGKSIAQWADVTTTSFFPTKPLGCMGDGGAILTNDGNLAESIKSLRVHGKGKNKYDNVVIGMNSRLDTIQAAILLQKLSIAEDERKDRHRIAQIYNNNFSDQVILPNLRNGVESAWALYTIRSKQRFILQKAFQAANVPTAVYYPTPMSLQQAYNQFPVVDGGCKQAHLLSQTALSLPLHPYLSDHQVNFISEVLLEALDGC